MAADVMTEQFARAIVAVIQRDYDTFENTTAVAVREGPGTPEENTAAIRQHLAERRHAEQPPTLAGVFASLDEGARRGQ